MERSQFTVSSDFLSLVYIVSYIVDEGPSLPKTVRQINDRKKHPSNRIHPIWSIAMSTFGRKSSSQSSRVFLNVYDLNEQSNEYLYPLGLGLYHSGVEISGIEYTFAGESGIYEMTPKNAPPAKFRESIDLGPSPTSREISNAIEELRHDFKGTDYHVLNKNCNHFAGCTYHRNSWYFNSRLIRLLL